MRRLKSSASPRLKKYLSNFCNFGTSQSILETTAKRIEVHIPDAEGKIEAVERRWTSDEVLNLLYRIYDLECTLEELQSSNSPELCKTETKVPTKDGQCETPQETGANAKVRQVEEVAQDLSRNREEPIHLSKGQIVWHPDERGVRRYIVARSSGTLGKVVHCNTIVELQSAPGDAKTPPAVVYADDVYIVKSELFTTEKAAVIHFMEKTANKMRDLLTHVNNMREVLFHLAPSVGLTREDIEVLLKQK